MNYATQIGSGAALFEIEGGRFINATKPLPLVIRPLTELETWMFIQRGIRPDTQDKPEQRKRA